MDLLEYYPGDEVTLNNLAGIYIELEDWEKALGLLDGLVESGADRFGIWINLATVQRALGNLPEARRAIDRAVALSPDQSLGQLTRAEICMLQGDTPAARESGLRVCELEPRNAQAFLMVAEASVKLGLTAEACAAFEQVNRLNKRFLPLPGQRRVPLHLRGPPRRRRAADPRGRGDRPEPSTCHPDPLTHPAGEARCPLSVHPCAAWPMPRRQMATLLLAAATLCACSGDSPTRETNGGDRGPGLVRGRNRGVRPGL